MKIQKKEQPYCPAQHALALFLDLDNFAISGPRGQEIRTLVDALRPWGQVTVRRAYSSKFSPKRYLYPQLFQHQFEISELDSPAKHHKNSADIRITVEIMEMLHTRPGIQIYALASGDSDFISLVKHLHEHGCLVIGLGSTRNTARKLRTCCDVFICYEELTTLGARQPAAELAPVATPLKIGAAAMKTLLRKQKLMPPEPSVRRQILAQLTQLSFPPDVNFKELQNTLCQQCASLGISKTAVRNCLRALTRAGALVNPEEDTPLVERRIRGIAPLDSLEATICNLQIQTLLAEPNLIADPLAIAEAVYGDPQKASLIEKHYLQPSQSAGA